MQSRFRLKLVNECEEDLKEVGIYMCENRQCKRKLKVLQRFVTVYLDLELDNEDFFNHLVVVSGDSVVSEPFVLFPLRVEKGRMFAQSSIVKITNLTGLDCKGCET